MRTRLTLFLAVLLISLNGSAAPWTKVASISTGPTTASFSWVIGKRVFVGGGNNSLNLFEYDAAKNSWSSKGPMGGAMFHTFGIAFVANGKGYVVGGDTAGAQSTSASVWEYDPTNNQWALKGQFPGGRRKQGFCFVINNIAYIGGGTSGTADFNDFYKYDPAINQWQASSSTLPMGYISGTATFVLNGKGYVCGGQEYIPAQNGWEGRNAVWEFDPAGLIWQTRADMPQDKVFALGLTVGSSGLVIGGTSDFLHATNTVWKYDATANKWSAGDAYPNTFTLFATGFVLDTVYYVGAGSDLSATGATPTDLFYRHGDPAPTTIINPAITAGTVSIIPNPAKSSISIIGIAPNDIERLSVCNSLGRISRLVTAPNSVSNIPVTNLPPGIYYIRLETGGGQLVLTFLKE